MRDSENEAVIRRSNRVTLAFLITPLVSVPALALVISVLSASR